MSSASSSSSSTHSTQSVPSPASTTSSSGPAAVNHAQQQPQQQQPRQQQQQQQTIVAPWPPPSVPQHQFHLVQGPLQPGEYRDDYGVFTLAPLLPPVPPFPCQTGDPHDHDPRDTIECTYEHPQCDAHRKVIHIRSSESVLVQGVARTRFSIPWEGWECWYWMKRQIQDVTGLHPERQRLLFSGVERHDFTRHSGIQPGIIIQLILVKNHSQPATVTEESTL